MKRRDAIVFPIRVSLLKVHLAAGVQSTDGLYTQQDDSVEEQKRAADC